MISTIQAARGVAALAVVFYHVFIIMQQPEYGGHTAFASLAPHGLLGVNFFFVLSGFIIYTAHKGDIGRPIRIWPYAQRRFTRVYPVYWIYLTGYIAAAYIGLGSPDFSWRWQDLAMAYSLMAWAPSFEQLPLKVAWTLLFEMKFYALFMICIINWRAGLIALGAWLAWAIYAHYMGHAKMPEASPLWMMNFLFGMLAARMADGLPRLAALPLLVGGVAILALYGMLNPAGDVGAYKQRIITLMPLIACAFTFVVAGLALVEKRSKFRLPKFFTVLGDASYSIYLVHSAAISAALVVLTRLKLQGATVPTFIMLFVFATAVGWLAYRLVEKPLLRRLR